MSEPTTEELIRRLGYAASGLMLHGLASDGVNAAAERLKTLESALAAERAKVAAMMEAWPTQWADDRQTAPVAYETIGRGWFLDDLDGGWFDRPIANGPYPTREAAILAYLESRKAQETPT